MIMLLALALGFEIAIIMLGRAAYRNATLPRPAWVKLHTHSLRLTIYGQKRDRSTTSTGILVVSKMTHYTLFTDTVHFVLHSLMCEVF